MNGTKGKIVLGLLIGISIEGDERINGIQILSYKTIWQACKLTIKLHIIEVYRVIKITKK